MRNRSKQPFIIGNWKMYKTIEESIEYLQKFLPKIQNASAQIFLAVPFTALSAVAELCHKTPIQVGAQNMHDAEKGAFTGEIAGYMLREAGASFVILGHSERRRYFGETNQFINKKVKRAFTDKLCPVLCIGETAEERDNGDTEKVLSIQLEKCLEGISPEQIAQMMIAYEPVWAIGTGRVASPQTAQAAHSFCRQFIVEKFGKATAEKVVLLYGGSANGENGAGLLELQDVDGLLVGSASLEVNQFTKIVHLNVSKYKTKSVAL